MSDIKIYGSFTVPETPINDNNLATKSYVDSLVGMSLKSIIIISGIIITPIESGQIFYKSITSNVVFSLDTTNTNFTEDALFEFYVVISKTAVSMTFPSTWIWNGNSTPTTSSSGYYVFHIMSLDSGTTWLAEQCYYSSTRQ